MCLNQVEDVESWTVRASNCCKVVRPKRRSKCGTLNGGLRGSAWLINASGTNFVVLTASMNHNAVFLAESATYHICLISLLRQKILRMCNDSRHRQSEQTHR
jgi:hypothetical protein